jgi:hypothetical protein
MHRLQQATVAYLIRKAIFVWARSSNHKPVLLLDYVARWTAQDFYDEAK